MLLRVIGEPTYTAALSRCAHGRCIVVAQTAHPTSSIVAAQVLSCAATFNDILHRASCAHTHMIYTRSICVKSTRIRTVMPEQHWRLNWRLNCTGNGDTFAIEHHQTRTAPSVQQSSMLQTSALHDGLFPADSVHLCPGCTNNSIGQHEGTH